jgi:Xaa-Pro aminopeptidase
MVFTVEPGLYFPWGGVRIEDLVTIKNGEARVLGKTMEDIIEV